MGAVDWDKAARCACEAFRDGVNDWLNRSHIRTEPNTAIRPRSLASEVNFEVDVFRAVTAAGVPAPIARILASELWTAWKEWADGFQMPPTTQPASPLAQSSSPGESRLRASNIANRLLQNLRPYLSGAPPAAAAIQRLAEWIDSSFQQWKFHTKLSRPTAPAPGHAPMGPVPTFAAPMGPVPTFHAPMGPVPTFTGKTTSVMLGPRFGIPIS